MILNEIWSEAKFKDSLWVFFFLNKMGWILTKMMTFNFESEYTKLGSWKKKRETYDESLLQDLSDGVMHCNKWSMRRICQEENW